MTITHYGEGPGVDELANYLEDDWDDDALTGRSNPDTGVYQEQLSGGVGDLLKAIYRPEWTAESGSPSASGGALALSAGDTTIQSVKTPAMLMVGVWSFDWAFGTNPTAGSFDVSVITSTLATDSNGRANDGYFVFIQHEGTANFYRNDSGTATSLITGTWADDTNTHTSKTTRDEDGAFEFFVDGTSQGTGTDTTYTTTLLFIITNRADASVDCDNLQVN